MSLSRRAVLRRIAAVTAVFAEARAPIDAESAAGPIRLNRNENAYGPSAKTIAAMQLAARTANRHPEADADALRAKIAALHRVTQDQIVLGCGAGEILRMAVDAFA